ncbi:DUF6867 family protein [Azospirillum sp. SYSU D00513]|uniref:DUF6867 family protein n=1 Tax=Azospirillum sp. SYSU D00513 TaxID=2812561 RepID=UPI001A95B19C|nr:hypothetical protein [Azospirillum sp. SYSU D00513]
MDGLLGASLPVFIGLTLVVFGGGAFLTGQTLAQGWKPQWMVLLYAILLGVGDRFLVFALFGGDLLSVYGFLVHTAVLGVIALAAYRMSLARRMVRQYPWLYERSGPFGWRSIKG